MAKRQWDWKHFINTFVFVTLVASSIFVAVELVLAPSTQEGAEPFQRLKSDYLLMLVQCVLGVVAMLLPGMFQKRFNLIIPSDMLVLYTLFLYCAIYLGEVRSFYYSVPHWDTILHTFSGVMLGALGFSIISFLNRTDRVPLNLSPAFVAIFAFCFAVTMGVLWEIYEFTVDSCLGTNMQKFSTESGEPLLGHSAVVDTMKDLIVDAIGAAAISVLGYISIRRRNNWVEKLQLRFHRSGHRS